MTLPTLESVKWAAAKGVVGLIGLGMIAVGLRVVRLARSGWPDAVRRRQLRRRERAFREARATITRSVLVSADDDPPPFHFEIGFRFEVDGVVHDGLQSAFDLRPHRSAARELLQRLPVGAQVAAHYNPHDPDESFLEPSWVLVKSSFALVGLLLAMAAAFIAGGVAILVQHGVFRS